MKSEKLILLATQKNAADDDPATDAIFTIGTLASVLQLLKLPDGTVKVLVEGVGRARGPQLRPLRGLLRGRGRGRCRTRRRTRSRPRRWPRSVVTEFESYVKLNKKISPEVVAAVGQIDDYSKLADTIAVAPRDEDHRQAGRAGDHRRRKAPGEGARLHGERDLRAAGGEAHPLARQAPDGEDPARILPQRADEGDPEGTRRRGRQATSCRARRADQEDQAHEGGPRQGDWPR